MGLVCHRLPQRREFDIFDPGGNYPKAANSILKMANAINLSGATKPILSFWNKYSFAATCCTNYDDGYVEVSNDYGVT